MEGGIWRKVRDNVLGGEGGRNDIGGRRGQGISWDRMGRRETGRREGEKT